MPPRFTLVCCLFVFSLACGKDSSGTTDSGDAGVTADTATAANDAAHRADAANSPDVSTPGEDATSVPDLGSDMGPDATDNDMGPPVATGPVGFAAMPGLGLDATTGGAGGEVVVVTTVDELETAAEDEVPRIITVSGEIEGTMSITGANKTIRGMPGAVLRGSVAFNEVSNIIVQDLTFVGYNCSDTTDCGDGLDAIVVRRSHHLWFDHLDVSDGSDGNMDMRDADYVTVSWTRFHYSPARDAGSSGDPHRFSNLVTADTTERFSVTFHNCWWGENVHSRTPRVSLGRAHVFNNLYTSSGNESCVQLAADGEILVENNHFIEVDDPVKIGSSVTADSSVRSTGNLYEQTTGDTDDYGGAVFAPPYAYDLAPAEDVRDTVMNGAGPR